MGQQLDSKLKDLVSLEVGNLKEKKNLLIDLIWTNVQTFLRCFKFQTTIKMLF